MAGYISHERHSINMENETLEETFDKYMKGKIKSRERKLELLDKSDVIPMRAKLFRKSYEELVKAGFGKNDTMAILCSGAFEI